LQTPQHSGDNRLSLYRPIWILILPRRATMRNTSRSPRSVAVYISLGFALLVGLACMAVAQGPQPTGPNSPMDPGGPPSGVSAQAPGMFPGGGFGPGGPGPGPGGFAPGGLPAPV